MHLGVKSPKVKVTTDLCRYFDSDTITLVVFNAQLSYFIHRCRKVRKMLIHFGINRSKGKVITELCQHKNKGQGHK